MSNLILANQTSSPEQAGTGYTQLYAKDGKLYQQVGVDGEVAVLNAASSTGKVLQVIVGTQDTWVTHSAAGGYATTDLLADITLSSASNLVLVSFHLRFGEQSSGNNTNMMFNAAVYRTKDGGSAGKIAEGGQPGSTSYYVNQQNNMMGWSYTDTPAPTDIGTALRYEIFFKTQSNHTATVVHQAGPGTSTPAGSQITLMEISG